MKTIIYYFTGTGNSLAIARKIAEELKETGLEPIASFRDVPGKVRPVADRVGIICPVYDAGLPVIVAEFAGKLDLSAVSYTFAIVNFGGMGVSALHQLNRILLRSCNRKFDAAFAITMPANFPPLGVPPAGDKKEKILACAGTVLAGVAVQIGKGESCPPGFSPVSSLMRGFLYPPFSRKVRMMDKAFSVEETCTSCGTCAKVCPVGNITMENDRPVWHHHCELCCACLHFCPVEAIQLNMMRGTKGRGRYHHPALTIEDMKAQRGSA